MKMTNSSLKPNTLRIIDVKNLHSINYFPVEGKALKAKATKTGLLSGRKKGANFAKWAQERLESGEDGQCANKTTECGNSSWELGFWLAIKYLIDIIQLIDHKTKYRNLSWNGLE